MISNLLDNPRNQLHRRIFLSLQKNNLISIPSEERIDDALFTSNYFAEILTSRGWVKRADYYQTLSEILRLDLFDPRKDKVNLELISNTLYEEYKTFKFLPISRSSNNTVSIITSNISTELFDLLSRLYKSYKVTIASPDDLAWLLRKRFQNRDLHNSSNQLHENTPQASAKVVISKRAAIISFLAIVSLMFIADAKTFIIIGITTLLLCHFLKTYLVFSSLEFSYEFVMDLSDLNNLEEDTLPLYSIIVALYKEKEIIPQLIKSLSQLDYPQEKLDIKLVIEEDDQDTLEAIRSQQPPQNMDIIIVPSVVGINVVKTKPRACNYALPYCTGEYIALYDAEDVPDKMQLKKAVSQFRNAETDISCLQAKLNFYNADQNLLTKMFDMEYRIWFKLFLPGLHLLQSPIPLGGTSNHFKKDVLEKLGGWDAYNVTEDADLGIRMFLDGYKVGLLDSDTPEECPSTFGSWIKQRSRWIKGHLITFLVHTRNPVKLLQRLGFKNFLVLVLFIFFPILSFLFYPILWGIYIADFLGVDAFGIDTLIFSPEIKDALMVALLVPNVIYVLLAMVISIKDKRYSDIPFTLLQPLYWLIHSVAAYYAVYEAIRRPHHWNKTAHGVSFYDK
jgi:cellulose synthase/poly-beta-1,6-N-acetylglucosamine synthase-like glycosyltransferase